METDEAVRSAQLLEAQARAAELFQAIGAEGIALVQGAPAPEGYLRFRQANDFFYLCGVEVPHAYLLLDGASRRSTLFLPHRNERRERSEGKVLSADDAELVTKVSGTLWRSLRRCKSLLKMKANS